MTATEERLVDDVASQAGLVLRNTALIQQLRSSRQRLVEQVWELLSNQDRLPEWNGAFDRVENATGRLDEAGTTYTQVMRVAGVELSGDWEITEVEPGRRRQFRGTPPGCAACSGSETFEGTEGGTDYTVEIEYTLRGGPLGMAFDRVFGRSFIERVMESNIQGLRRILGA